MKKANIQDERIVSQKRRIGSDAFGIIYFGLIASILIQQFIFDAPFSQYAAEFILFMAAAAYIVVRNIIVGNSLFGDRFNVQKMVVINSVVCGLAITTITTTLNSFGFGLGKMGDTTGIGLTVLITFASGTLAAFIGFEFLYIINKRRQNQIDDKYKDTEE